MLSDKHVKCSLAVCTLLVGGAIASAPVYAQQEGADEIEEVVVTGSKLRRNEFSSISPVQVIGGQDSVRIGTVDVTQMIAESPFVFGTQLDGSTNSGTTTAAVEGVPASGPGAATVALRGLGPERTLLLVNGRRLAPSGVRGAPVAPDLNLIPSAMIDRIEILTDGASSIYGADAVAGVANIILRSEVEGVEVNAFGSIPNEDGGEEALFSFMGGVTNDSGNFTLAAEFFDRQHIFAGSRAPCLRDIESDPQGRVFSVCEDRRPDNSTFIGSEGFVWHTPGSTDLGVPDWSTTAATTALLGQDPRLGANTPYNLQDEERATQLLGDLRRINLYATGEYEYAVGHNVYVEGSYTQRQNTDIFTSEQAFPGVPAMIPFIDPATGNLSVDPVTGAFNLVDNPLNPFTEDALPVYSLDGLSQRRETDVDNVRLVLGVEGDLPFLQDRGWVYDFFFAYEESSGTSVQAGMLEPHIQLSLDTLHLDANGEPACGLPRTALSFGFVTPRPCVVVDYFANSLFTTGGGDKTFATQEETDFLFGNVINTTQLKQNHFSALVTGDLFEFAGGTVGLVLGAEYRDNEIDSANDIIRAQALAASEVVDQEGDTIGKTDIIDFYLETEVPFGELATINLSGRYTDEKNFGDEFTYSVKGDISPTDWLRVRGTYGTTFRAPNLREQFLAGQAGTIAGGNDPCAVPTEANNGGVYDPTSDPRTQRVLDNCVLDGVDPTAFSLQATVAVPTQTGGSTNIGAETSDSFTAGFVLTPSWNDLFQLDLSLTYFSIEVEDTVEESDPIEILERCYNDEDNLASAFCDRITRRGVNPANNSISVVDSSFINVGLVTSKGYDINARFADDFALFNRDWDITASLTATNYAELEEQVNPDSPIDDRVGEVGFPEWSWVARANLNTGNWQASYRMRFIDDFAKDPDDVNPSSNGSTKACQVLGGGDNCVRKHWGDSVLYHDLSLTYEQDTWSVSLGIRNITDEDLPLIDQGEGPARMNMVVQSGYDLYGRRVFANATKRW